MEQPCLAAEESHAAPEQTSSGIEPRNGGALQPHAPRAAPPSPLPALAATLTAATALASCGGGSDAQGGSPPPPPAQPVSASDASRFLAQASMGADRDAIARVQALGYAGWIDEQIAMPASTARFDWLLAKGYADIANKNSQAGFDASAWRKLLASPDTLRQRMTLALSEIMVVGIDGLAGAPWKAFSAAAYLDVLEAGAFGNYRNLLQQVSTSVAMGLYLTFRGNAKANAATGSLPDENYARELMQLFTLGLLELNLDGTHKQGGGGDPIETYGQDDITGLARVFTGWDIDLAGGNTDTPEFQRRPMRQVASRHETGAKAFLGTTIPAGNDGATDLTLALDAIFAHANIAPFVSRQLIQRLVTSNPSPAYVARVATVFNDNGAGVKGDLAAVLKALLLDAEARDTATARSAVAFGKLREPMLRLAGWSRAYHADSPSDAWGVGNTSDPATKLGQSPLRSNSVFNFFRPGYVPPGSAIASANLVAPEFQITNESSVVGYVNYMQKAVANGVGDVKADYASLLPLAGDAAALLAEINLVLAGGSLSDATLASMSAAVGSMASGNDSANAKRVNAALVLVLAAPEFIVQR